jgi:hypothetical protein
MPKPITLRFVTRTLARLKHVTKIEPNGLQTLASVLVTNHWGRPSQLEHLARFLSDTAGTDATVDGRASILPGVSQIAA